MTLSRRSFIRKSAATAALTSFCFPIYSYGPQDKVYRVALIGTGWYGKSDLFRLMQVAPVEVVGLCDVDQNQLSNAIDLVAQRQQSGNRPKGFKDHNELLAQTEPDIVLIGTPDHWHALQAIDAIRSGAHVYLQKPISVDVLEGEAILATARKFNRVVQIGTQRRSTPHLVKAKKEIVDTGMLGKVSHVEMCCYYHMRANDNPPETEVPDFLDYEKWTGPAPYRPYDKLPHRGWWRAFMEYSNGIMGDMCVHMFDAVRWNLGLGWPTKISSTGGIYMQKESKATTPDTQTATFEYPELTCVWNHRTWGAPTDPEFPWSYKIFGDKGTLKADVYKYQFDSTDGDIRWEEKVMYEREQYPEDLSEDSIELHAAPATRAHMKDFIAAIENNSRPIADVEEGHISTASCIIANISMHLGRPISYDPVSRTVPGDEEATRLLARSYRQGYDHPTP